MNIQKEDFIFIPVGGSDSIGMNANLYHFNSKWILMDLGISFPDETQLGVDILLPDFDFIKSLKNNLLGIFLTHGHEDHFGAIQYFFDDITCPIWGSEFTLALLKRKLHDNNIRNLKLNPFPKSKTLKIGDFKIKAIKSPHSIPQALSYLIEAGSKVLFHTGDWKFEPSSNLQEKSNLNDFKNLSKLNITCAISDSTNALIKGRTESEDFAYNGLLDVIKGQSERVVVTCFSSNVSRIKSLIKIAKLTKRKICILGRALQRAVDAAVETRILVNDFETVSLKDLNKVNPKNLLIICSGSQGETNSALTRISKSKHEKIKLDKGDTVIFSSRKIPGNENAISKVENNFSELGVIVINDEDNDNIHVSGHPSSDELVDMYSLLKPQCVIPVHGNRKQIEANLKLAKSCQIKNVLIPKNGNVIRISNNKLSLIDQIKINTKVFDSGSIVSINDEKFTIRKHALWNGFITVSIVVNSEGEMMTVPKVSQAGISGSEKMKNILLEISLKIEDFFETVNEIDFKNDLVLQDEIKKIVNVKIKKSFFVRPVINVHVNRLI